MQPDVSFSRHHDTMWWILPLGVFVLVAAVALVAYGVAPDDYRSLEVALPLILIIGLILLVRPEYTVYLSLAYLPFESDAFILINLPGGLTVSKLLGATLIAAFAFNVIFRGYPLRLLDDPQDFTVLLFAAALLLSGINSEFPDKSLSSTVRMFRFFAFYFAVKNLITTPAQLRAVLWIIFIGGAFASWWGLKEYFDVQAVRVHDIRVRGIMMDPNVYALYAIFVVAAGVFLLSLTQRKVLKVLVLIGIFSNLIGIIMSASRGGTLALSIVTAIYVFTHPQRWRMLAILVLLAIIAIPFMPDSILIRFGVKDAPPDSVYVESAEFSMNRRLSYIEYSKTLIVDSPLIGIGYGTFSQYYPRSKFAQIESALTMNTRVAHSTYLEIGVGAGAIGLATYLLLLTTILFDLYSAGWRFNTGPIKQAAGRAFFFGMLGFVVASVFLSVEHFNLLWISCAVASSLRYMIAADPANATTSVGGVDY